MATSGSHSDEETIEGVDPLTEHEKLAEYGMPAKVAAELDLMYTSGILSQGDLNERALNGLKDFLTDNALSILKTFKESNLKHVHYKSAYLYGLMKKYRNANNIQFTLGELAEKKLGPNEAKLKEILDRTGYQLDLTPGQRKYGGPPPGWKGPEPGEGCEVFCGNIPYDLFEDDLIPLFEKCGKIWELRLITRNKLNKGYCFTTFVDKEGATTAINQLNNYEIKPGERLDLTMTILKARLFVHNIPKSKSREEIQDEFAKITKNLQNVTIESSPDALNEKNHVYTSLEYATHKDARDAKLLISKRKLWGCNIDVSWAHHQNQPDSKPRVIHGLFVNNLKSAITEDQLKEHFKSYGKIENVVKIKTYAFIKFEDQENALKAMDALNGTRLGDSKIQVSLAKRKFEGKLKGKGPDRSGRSDEFGGGPLRQGFHRGERTMRSQVREGRFDYEYGGYDAGGDYAGGYANDYYDYYGMGGFEDFSYHIGYRPRGGRNVRSGPCRPPRRGRGGVLLGRTHRGFGVGRPRRGVPISRSGTGGGMSLVSQSGGASAPRSRRGSCNGSGGVGRGDISQRDHRY